MTLGLGVLSISPAFVFALNSLAHCTNNTKTYLYNQLSDTSTSIRLDNMSITDQCGADLVNYLEQGNKPVEKLSLKNNTLGESFAHALAKLFKQDTCKLTAIDLSYNHFDLKAMKVLFQAISHAKKMNSFDFEGNNLGVLKQADFNGLMENFITLSHFNIAYNAIDSKLIEGLLDVLPDMQLLISLNLSYNPISDEGLEQLSEALYQMQALRNLNLEFIKSSTKGAESFVNTLIALDHPLAVNFAYNYYSDAVLQRIKNHIKEDGWEFIY